MSERFGELHESGFDERGHFFSRVLPTWSCGHCSRIHKMKSMREAPSTACVYCMRFICPDQPICHLRCTPLYSMAEDRFEKAGPWAELVPAIMSGQIDVDTLHKKG
jgi:hypothetical protein